MSHATLSGIEFLQEIISGDIPQPAMAKTMQAKLINIEKGFARFEAKAGEEHLNPMQGVHGGFACTLLDSATGCSIHSMLEPYDTYGTIELNVKMMRPIPTNTRLFAESRVINMSKSLGVSEGKLIDEQGKLYAHATCTCMIKRAQ